jgi:hypothetical protein
VHTTDAVVDDANGLIVLGDGGMPNHLGAKTVVPQEDVADSGNQDACCH